MAFSYSYARPALTTDILVFHCFKKASKLLLIKRKYAPFINQWALPGGFVEENETLEVCANRELEEETGLKNLDLKQFKAYSEPGRDPRGWTISVVFHVCLDEKISPPLRANDDAAEVAWFYLDELPTLAFDHKLIIDEAVKTFL